MVAGYITKGSDMTACSMHVGVTLCRGMPSQYSPGPLTWKARCVLGRGTKGQLHASSGSEFDTREEARLIHPCRLFSFFECFVLQSVRYGIGLPVQTRARGVAAVMGRPGTPP